MAGYAGAALAVCLLPVILYYVVAILLCIWVYRDAESRGMGGALWLIVVLLTGLIGLIIYLVVRKPRGTPSTTPTGAPIRVCPSCGREIAPDAKFCPHCGKPIPD